MANKISVFLILIIVPNYFTVESLKLAQGVYSAAISFSLSEARMGIKLTTASTTILVKKLTFSRVEIYNHDIEPIMKNTQHYQPDIVDDYLALNSQRDVIETTPDSKFEIRMDSGFVEQLHRKIRNNNLSDLESFLKYSRPFSNKKLFLISLSKPLIFLDGKFALVEISVSKILEWVDISLLLLKREKLLWKVIEFRLLEES